MFTIIGGDGKEYGPVTVEQMQQWLAGGRVNLETQTKKTGDEQWRRLGDHAEFANGGIAPPIISADPSLAGRGARTGAAFINAAVYCCGLLPGIAMMSAKVVAQGAHTIEQLDPSTLGGGMHVMQAGMFAALAVQTGLLALRSQNLGMLLLGLRVVRVSDHQPAGFIHAALLRFLLPVSLIFMPGAVAVIGFLLLCVDYCFLFRDDRRCLHDLIAGTQVVKT